MQDRLNDVPVVQLLERPENTKHSVTCNTPRANLVETMDRVCDDHEPVVITRNGKQGVVLLSLDDFKSREETSYLLRSPVNAKRLIEGIASLESSQDAAEPMIDPILVE